MAENKNKYVSLSKLSIFFENLKKIFSPLVHTHKISDITDYTIDSELSSTSNNPVANNIINAEFDAISDAMGALELAINGKSNDSHNHNDLYYTEAEIDSKLDEKADSEHAHSNYVPVGRKVNGKELNTDIALTASDVGALPADTVIPTVPTNVSAFTNDAGYLTEHQSLTGLATETYVDEAIANIDAQIGDLSGLQTTNKDNLVAAINEVAASGAGTGVPTGGIAGQVLTMSEDGTPVWADATGGASIPSAEEVSF